MADHNPQQGRRPHFHRGRRGHERRGNERRGPSQPQEQGGRDHVDVEQIMREIRSRISQRHGIDLTAQQIQELAARRLEAILDPRTVKPSLLEQIRRSASTPVDVPAAPEPAFTFEDTTIYDSRRASLRFFRRLLNPILKLFFNPNPIISALHTQAKLNQAAAEREAERERRQTEWNALHYDILQRLVLDVTRTSLEAQQLWLRVEALAAKVDFAERRTRSMEASLQQARPAPRQHDSAQSVPHVSQQSQQPRESGPVEVTAAAPVEGAAAEGGRRRRRRRRGRRPQGMPTEGAGIAMAAGAALPDIAQTPEGAADADEPDDDEGLPESGDDREDVEAPLTVIEPPAVQVESTPESDTRVVASVPAEPAAPQRDTVIAEPTDRPPQPGPLGDDVV